MSALAESRSATRTRTFEWEDPAASADAGLKLSGLDYMRAIAAGTLPHRGRRTATAEGRVFAEADEKLIAHGSTGCVIFA